MALAVSVFEGEEHGVVRILTYACTMEKRLPAVRRNLGRPNYDEVFLGVFESSSIQSSGGIVSSQFSMAIFERETNAQIWEGLTCAKRLCEFNRFKRLHAANDIMS